jgi:hypothetical protein
VAGNIEVTVAEFLATKPPLEEIEGAIAFDGIGQRLPAADMAALKTARLGAMKDQRK